EPARPAGDRGTVRRPDRPAVARLRRPGAVRAGRRDRRVALARRDERGVGGADHSRLVRQHREEAAMKIRLWGTEDECKRMAQLLIDAPGFEVVSVSEPYA